ncbi:MAG: hypothetical protein OXT67_03840 [Zetaproteobacteria bacterium]|nr:hypothetical protein [Zetaproteobacteria bacterium]
MKQNLILLTTLATLGKVQASPAPNYFDGPARELPLSWINEQTSWTAFECTHDPNPEIKMTLSVLVGESGPLVSADGYIWLMQFLFPPDEKKEEGLPDFFRQGYNMKSMYLVSPQLPLHENPSEQKMEFTEITISNHATAPLYFVISDREAEQKVHISSGEGKYTCKRRGDAGVAAIVFSTSKVESAHRKGTL